MNLLSRNTARELPHSLVHFPYSSSKTRMIGILPYLAGSRGGVYASTVSLETLIPGQARRGKVTRTGKGGECGFHSPCLVLTNMVSYLLKALGRSCLYLCS